MWALCKSILLHSLAPIYWALNFSCDIDEIENWDIYSMLSTADILNMTGVDIPNFTFLWMAFVRRQGLLGHCRLFTVLFYLLQPFFVCEILQFSGRDNKTCNPWMSARVPRVQVNQCPGSALYCQLWSQGKLQQSHHSAALARGPVHW